MASGGRQWDSPSFSDADPPDPPNQGDIGPTGTGAAGVGHLAIEPELYSCGPPEVRNDMSPDGENRIDIHPHEAGISGTWMFPNTGPGNARTKGPEERSAMS